MAADWLPLLKGIRASRRHLATGEVLFRADDPVQALCLVESGTLRLSRGAAPVHTAGAGSLVGEAGLFTESHGCDAVATEPTRVALYSKTAMLLHLKVHPDLALAFAACLARSLDAARARLELARIRSARERVLAWLNQHGVDGVVALDRPLTQVARDIGLTHEALYRALAKLEKEATIRRDGKRRFVLSAIDRPAAPPPLPADP